MSIEKNLNEKKHHSETSERYLQFDLGAESYAIHLLSVKEVIPRPRYNSSA
jgi:chemotaxis signal transduction protein